MCLFTTSSKTDLFNSINIMVCLNRIRSDLHQLYFLTSGEYKGYCLDSMEEHKEKYKFTTPVVTNDRGNLLHPTCKIC